MKVLVPSRDRPDIAQQITASQLTNAEISFEIIRTAIDTTIYPAGPNFNTAPTLNYSQKCRWILENYGVGGQYADTDGKFLKIDDDLKLYDVSKDGVPTEATDQTWRIAVEKTKSLLDHFPLVSVAPRFMIHCRRRPFERNFRTQAWIGWNTKLLPTDRTKWPIYDRLSTLQDADVQLQLLSMGLESATITTTCFREVTAKRIGGCAVYRTAEMSLRNHHELQKLWPDYVTLKSTDLGLVFISETIPEYRIQLSRELFEAYGAPMDFTGHPMKIHDPERNLGQIKSVIRFRIAARRMIDVSASRLRHGGD